MKELTILIPTYHRLAALATTLMGLCFQSSRAFDIIVSDQNDEQIADHPSLKTIQRILKQHDVQLTFLHHLPRQGMAEQREFLLSQVQTRYALFLDDDIILESFVVRNLMQTMQKEQCGFVGMPLIGLSYFGDRRPDEEEITFWQGPVQPEIIEPGSQEWERYRLHNAANVQHVSQQLQLTPDNPRPYKVAWVGGCTLYDTEKLRTVGGFSFKDELPLQHCGEDVLAQLRVMARFGGCGILPSGAYHQEVPTTVKKREINAPEYLAKN